LQTSSFCEISSNSGLLVPLRFLVRPLATFAAIVAFSAAAAQDIPIVRLDQFQQLIGKEKERVQVINFWATWCAPCIKELPLLEKLHSDRKDVLVRLVSMDMDLDPDPEKVRKFAARKKIQSDVYILNEKNPNSWIDKLEKEWSGALPATLIINNKNGKRKFVERELHDGDLEKMIAEVQ
jgi:thiol-disulfide isomerase/thioredoxin